jgi:hypothetical protein
VEVLQCQWEHKIRERYVLDLQQQLLAMANIHLPVLASRQFYHQRFFSTNLESVQKDLECILGIFKKQWKVLNHGFKFCKMEQCKKIFITCCVLHNFLLDMMERNNVRVGCGYPIGDNGVWLDGHTVNVDTNSSERFLLIKFGMRRSLLAKHLRVFREKGTINENDN